MKFCVDIIFWTGSCLIIQSYSPGGTTFQISLSVSVTALQWPRYDGTPVARLPVPQLSCQFGLVWHLTIDYG